jgi:nicotinamidase-related amidase
MAHQDLPLPPHFNPAKVEEIWKVPYEERAEDAETWAKLHNIHPSATDSFKICLVAIDVQNTFCIPGFELFVGGRSGTGAVEDNRRLCEFIYRNMNVITRILPTMDTHQAMQIFHPVFWVNERGEHPEPFTLISVEDVEKGRWKFNSAFGQSYGIDEQYAYRYLLHYTKTLEKGGKYELTIWPYHVLLGSIGHALVPAVEEAIFFHSIARCSRPNFQVKGDNPFTEHYSVLGPEVLKGPGNEEIAQRNVKFIEELLEFDAVIIAGQAKSHCVAWTIADLLEDIFVRDKKLARKVHLLEDCTSPVVIPGVMDYTDDANAAFQRFEDAGMHIVHSTDPVASWPGIEL